MTKVYVKPGDRVEDGDVLVRFHASDEAAELRAASKEFDNQLAKLLLRENDPATREALVSLRTRRELAQQRAEQRTLLAPHGGFVGDVRVRESQLVEPGMRVLDLQDSAASATLDRAVARTLPAAAACRPSRCGSRSTAFTSARTSSWSAGSAIRCSGRAKRRATSDAISPMRSRFSGPVVLVQASLPSTSFVVEGQRYEFASGMFGLAEAVVRDEPIAYAFIPGLRPWVERVAAAEPLRDLAAWVKHGL